MVSLNWVMQQTERLFDFSWLCGSMNNVSDEPPTSTLNVNARFVQNVWSDLEYESSLDDSFDEGITDDDEDDDDNDDDAETDTGTDVQSSPESILSCREPQERGSNIPVLRQLPSFGSALASNSLQSGMDSNGTGLSSYPTRSTSLESSSSRRFSIKPIWASIDEESSIHVDMNIKTHPRNTVPTESFIFLRQ